MAEGVAADLFAHPGFGYGSLPRLQNHARIELMAALGSEQLPEPPIANITITNQDGLPGPERNGPDVMASNQSEYGTTEFIPAHQGAGCGQPPGIASSRSA